MIFAFDVVTDHAEVVDDYMCKLGTARHFTDGPNTWRGSFKPFIDFDVTVIGQFDPGYLEADIL
jgi:hypothetical protein